MIAFVYEFIDTPSYQSKNIFQFYCEVSDQTGHFVDFVMRRLKYKPYERADNKRMICISLTLH